MLSAPYNNKIRDHIVTPKTALRWLSASTSADSTNHPFHTYKLTSSGGMKIILSFNWHLPETKLLLYIEVSNIV